MKFSLRYLFAIVAIVAAFLFVGFRAQRYWKFLSRVEFSASHYKGGSSGQPQMLEAIDRITYQSRNCILVLANLHIYEKDKSRSILALDWIGGNGTERIVEIVYENGASSLLPLTQEDIDRNLSLRSERVDYRADINMELANKFGANLFKAKKVRLIDKWSQPISQMVSIEQKAIPVGSRPKDDSKGFGKAPG